jgi:hypothetical protein
MRRSWLVLLKRLTWGTMSIERGDESSVKEMPNRLNSGSELPPSSGEFPWNNSISISCGAFSKKGT